MSDKPVSALRIVVEFFWRGALLGIVGGFAVPIVTIQIILAAVVLIPYDDTPILVRLALPGGTLLGMAIGYASARLDGTREYRQRMVAVGYIGFSIGGYYSSIAAFLALVFGGVMVIGPIAGLGAGLIVAALAACITHQRYRVPVDAIAYERAMRRHVAAAGFVVGAATWMIVVGGLYGLWATESVRSIAGWIAIAVVAGLVSASFACCKSSCLTDWYSRVWHGLPSPLTIILRDFRSTTTPSGGSI